MKRIGIVLGMAFIMGVGTLFAQTKRTAEEPQYRSEAYYNRLTENLELNDSQKKQIKSINEKFLTERREKVNTTREQREEQRIAWAKKQIEREDAIRKVLTKEQYAKYYANKHHRHQYMRADNRSSERKFKRSEGRRGNRDWQSPQRRNRVSNS